MVKRESFVYLFIGQDIVGTDGLSRKSVTLKNIKEQHLSGAIESFNSDTLYARQLTLKDLQEKLLLFPVRAQKRIVVIKNAESLKEEVKEFILKYVVKPSPTTILILDIDDEDSKDTFLKRIYNHAQVFRFKIPVNLNAFNLSRAIDMKKADYALLVLNQLLENGEKPEWILSGLRYAWGKNITTPEEKKRRLKFLLACDMDIKTGKLKPVFVLEKLIIKLCASGKPLG